MNSATLVGLYALPPRHLLEPQCVYELVASFESEQGRSTLNRLLFDFIPRHISPAFSFWPWRTVSVVPTIAGSVVIVVRSLIIIPLRSVCEKVLPQSKCFKV